MAKEKECSMMGEMWSLGLGLARGRFWWGGNPRRADTCWDRLSNVWHLYRRGQGWSRCWSWYILPRGLGGDSWACQFIQHSCIRPFIFPRTHKLCLGWKALSGHIHCVAKCYCILFCKSVQSVDTCSLLVLNRCSLLTQGTEIKSFLSVKKNSGWILVSAPAKIYICSHKDTVCYSIIQWMIVDCWKH